LATYNVATGDYITVGEIAELAVKVVGLDPGRTSFEFGGGDRGWTGDVPVVRLDTSRIRRLGWTNAMTTAEALNASLESMVSDVRAGRMG
jgi:UDP-glucose 4-epimerase